MTATTKPARPGEAHAQRARPNGVQTHSVSGCWIVGKDTRVLKELGSGEICRTDCQQGERKHTHQVIADAIQCEYSTVCKWGQKRSQNRAIVSFSPCPYGHGGLKGIGLYPILGQRPFARCSISTLNPDRHNKRRTSKRRRAAVFCWVAASVYLDCTIRCESLANALDTDGPPWYTDLDSPRRVTT
jgi:hypothetical protein